MNSNYNGCRHSFGSYCMADIKNVYQVAEEMGNSPAMVKKHYFQAVTNALRVFFMRLLFPWGVQEPPDPTHVRPTSAWHQKSKIG